jgi:hypothetical protein
MYVFLLCSASHFTNDNNSMYADLHCDLDPSASEAACTETIGGSEANYPGTSTTTFGPDDYTSFWLAVTVTAGSVTGTVATTAASATAPTATATTKAAASAATTAASTGSAASTASDLSTVATSASTVASSASTGTASAKAASSSSTGGMPQITGNAQWAMGGVAVAVALAAL